MELYCSERKDLEKREGNIEERNRCNPKRGTPPQKKQQRERNALVASSLILRSIDRQNIKMIDISSRRQGIKRMDNGQQFCFCLQRLEELSC